MRDRPKKLSVAEGIHQARCLLKNIARYENPGEIGFSLLRRRSPTHIMLKDGTEIAAPANSNVLDLVDEIFCQETYTRGPYSIGPSDIVVDVGANIGVFTLFAAKKTRGNVYAFEAHPSNADFVRRNAEANHLHQVTVAHTAVGRASGTVSLAVSPMSGMNWVLGEKELPVGDTRMDVPCVTLPEIMDRHHIREINFLKMDCEGSEGDILKATPAAYLERIRKIAMEFHDNVSSLNHEEIAAMLRAAGFLVEIDLEDDSPFGFLRARKPS